MAKPHSTIPLDVPQNPPEHSCSKAPSHNLEFVKLMVGPVSPAARRKLAAETRRVLNAADLYPTQDLRDVANYTADDLRADIERALPYIAFDDLFALACLCDRFTLCGPEAH